MLDINKIENEWDRVRPQLEEVFNDIDVYDMERLSLNFEESLDYLEAVYNVPSKHILEKISPLFDPKIRPLLKKYVEEINHKYEI
ncbi:MAG: hypothetical protein BGO76_06390 [Caedibacter sp. 38-128]|nr:MAG: hypothetical protein BGO76_06390 [Caedibacter sp. 38-128]